MENFDKFYDLKKQDIPDLEGWIGDAKFGFDQIYKYFDNSKRQDVLEIGCGIGILLNTIKGNFPNLTLEGIEPYKAGFDRLKIAKETFSEKIKINIIKFENFKPKKKYDIIYSVNVFEHLNNWKQYLEKTRTWLKPEGTNIILCPNYSFPYESHFKIPILFNKKITYFFYKKKINLFEKEKKSLGLWNSLNFVTMRNIKLYCKNNSMNFKYCNSIFYNIVQRLDEDREFQKRQNFVGACAKFLKKLGFLKLFNKKLFYFFHPYMKIEITSREYKKN